MAGTATALAAGSIALLPGAASAEDTGSGPLNYSCTYGSLVDGAQSTAVVITIGVEPDAPKVGDVLDITSTTQLTLPASVMAAVKALSPTAVKLVAQDDTDANRLGVKEIYVSGSSQTQVPTHPAFTLKQDGTSWVFTGSSPAPNHVDPGPKAPGAYEIRAAGIDLEFQVTTASGTTTYPVTCGAIAGNPLIDSMLVTAPTTTAVALGASSWTYPAAGPSATATVASPGAASSWPAIAGTVQFYDGTAKLGAPVTVGSNGKATLTHLSGLTLGNHQITATYLPAAGGPYAGSSASASQPLTVNTKTTTKVTAPASVDIDATGATATATVKSSEGSTPTGTVTFSVDDTQTTVPLQNGTASLPLPTGTPGLHSVTATYDGSGNYLASGPDTTSYGVGVAATTTTLRLNHSSTAYGIKTTAKATVSSTHGTPAGTVTFKVGSHTYHATVKNGVASYTLPALAPGSYRVTAAFAPTDTDTYLASTSAASTLRITKDSTRTTSSVRGVRLHQKPTATVAVHSTHRGAVSGKVKVQLKRYGRVMQTRTLTLRNGRATANFWKINRAGTWRVVATYAGNASLTKSAITKMVVVKAPKPVKHKKAHKKH
ncbi:Ig-like domain-containing protein [Nocardioides sp. DS6]|uniref:Ig-like domain-containing protein n=1 Tax=Nocardioides eburneus TaxID=3231482 RepID=A0ABV3SZZ2_9ACTN